MSNHNETRRSREPVKTLARRLGLLSVIFSVLAAGAGCTTETTGQPSTSTSGGPASSQRPTIPGDAGTPAGSSTKPDAASSPVRNTDPCGLLTSAEAGQIGAGNGKRDEDTSSGTSRSCQFAASGDFNLRVIVFDVLGTKDVQATADVKPLPPIGRHQAVQAIFGTACAVSVAVSGTSRVDAVVSANGDTTKGCQIAMRVAQLVEPKLPGGS